MGEVISEIETAPPVDIENVQIAPEVLCESGSKTFIPEGVIHALRVEDAWMTPHSLRRWNTLDREKIAKDSFDLRHEHVDRFYEIACPIGIQPLPDERVTLCARRLRLRSLASQCIGSHLEDGTCLFCLTRKPIPKEIP